MKNNAYINMTLFLSLLIFYSCEDQENLDGETDMVEIGMAISQNNTYEIKLFAQDTLFEGYNPVYLSIKEIDSNNKLTDAVIHMQPIMDMIDMVHAAPVENPEGLANEEGLFEGAIVFIMPSTDMMGWTLKVEVGSGTESDMAEMSIPVVRSLEEPRKISVISPLDDTKYFLSLVQPTEPIVGMNDCEIAVHYKENMMSFPPVTDLSIEISPEMPSMDHGSPNNVNPVHSENGHYEGNVNFTMTGWWRIHLLIKKGSDTITNEAYLDITLK